MSKNKLSLLVKRIQDIKRSEVSKIIETRIKEFRSFLDKPSKEIFIELCFCILTANFNAEKSIEIQKRLGEGFITMSEKELSENLKKLGHRYPSRRAKFIIEARKYKDTIKDIINSFKNKQELREWLSKNIKGIGYKEASHFLRNIGYTDLAIIDFHVLDISEKYELIKKPKTLTKKKYLEIERLLREISKEVGLTLAELDLYLWYLETRKVLK